MQATTFYYFGLYMDFGTDIWCKYICYWISCIKSINSDIIKNFFNIARKRISQKGLLLLAAICLLALLCPTVLQRKQDPHPRGTQFSIFYGDLKLLKETYVRTHVGTTFPNLLFRAKKSLFPICTIEKYINIQSE